MVDTRAEGESRDFGKLISARFGAKAVPSYLNTASSCLPPADTTVAVADWMADWAANGANHASVEGEIEKARALVAGLLGQPATAVGAVASCAQAASMIATQLPDANVVVPAEEFRSNLLPWTTSRPAKRVRLVPGPAITDRLCAAIEPGTDVVAVSATQSASGLRVDLARVVARAHEVGALAYVDASQSLGIDPALSALSATGDGPDFVSSVGYKWILGARGAGYLMVDPRHHSRFAPVVPAPEGTTGFAAGEFYGAEFEPWPDARRFDQPPAWFSWVAAVPGLRLITEIGVPALAEHALTLAEKFRAGVTERGISPGPRDQPSPIVAVPHADADRIAGELAAGGVKISARGGNLRFSFHLYNSEADVDRALELLTNAN